MTDTIKTTKVTFEMRSSNGSQAMQIQLNLKFTNFSRLTRLNREFHFSPT